MMNESSTSFGRRLAYTAAPAFVILGLVAFFLLPSPEPVEIVRVARDFLCETVDSPGTVHAHITITVSTQMTGLLMVTHVDQGDSVRKGEPFASLNDRDLVARADAARMAVDAARENVSAAEADLAKSQAELELARATDSLCLSKNAQVEKTCG